MKKSYLSRMTILSVFLFSFLFIAGCGSSGGGTVPIVPVVNTNVIVQLQAGGSNYLVDGMTVSIQKTGGSVLTGVTGTNGIASIPVTETGDYNVIQVEGVDATDLAQGSEAGREFVKSNPIANPYPNLTYTFGGTFPVVSVSALGSDYTVNAPVPSIIKVTVLKTGISISNANGDSTVVAGTTAFTGRVMISNLNFNDYGVLRINSNDVNADTLLNTLLLYINPFGTTPAIGSSSFWGGSPSTETAVGFLASYAQAGPIYFEAPGTNGGDWALGYNLSTTDLKTRGPANAIINFPGFNGGASNSVLGTFSSDGDVDLISFDYRIFKFDQYL